MHATVQFVLTERAAGDAASEGSDARALGGGGDLREPNFAAVSKSRASASS